MVRLSALAMMMDMMMARPGSSGVFAGLGRLSADCMQ